MIGTVQDELKFAQGMVERREFEASTIGRAKSAEQAKRTYRSMTACVREVAKHRDNILNAIDDKTAFEAKEVLALFVTAMDWQYRAGEDAKALGVSEFDIERIVSEVHGGYAQ